MMTSAKETGWLLYCEGGMQLVWQGIWRDLHNIAFK